MNPAIRERGIRREMETCRHFTGIQHATCKAGVAYLDVRDESKPGPFRWPCLNNPELASCPKRTLPSREEAERAYDERTAEVEKALAAIRLGICATCGVEGTDWKQVGECIYAEPCGHRVGQGIADSFKRGVLEARAAKAAAK